MNRRSTFVFFTIALMTCAACTSSRGAPRADSEIVPPSQMLQFSLLYRQNCAGCHGAEGKGGASFALADSVYLAIADDNVIRRTTSQGVTGTAMPAFAESAGGMLTDKQIESLVQGIRSWAKPDSFRGTTLPRYAAQSVGDPQRGANVYQTYCSSCHGVDGRGGKASSIVDGSYLALVSDQQLRTIVITGRPDLGAPDWRNDV
jgi:cytochrome c oxidase cbb3-type subunit 3